MSLSTAQTDCALPATGIVPPTPPRVEPTDHDLTIIIPALNEEKRLPRTLADLDLFLKGWDVDSRVVVVDDGSCDGTTAVARNFGPRFSTIRIPQQRGKGNAVRTAMLQATGRVVAFTDADLPFDLQALAEGYRWIRSGQCHVVFGARDLHESTNLARRRWARRIATFVYREILRSLVSREVTDTQCGLKLFSREAALAIFPHVTIAGFAFDAEVVLLTRRLSIPFRRVPVALVNEYGSTISLSRHALPMLGAVVRAWFRELRGGYPSAAQFPLPGSLPLPEKEATRRAA